MAVTVDHEAERLALWQLYRGLSQRAYEREGTQTVSELCRLVLGLGEQYRAVARVGRTDRPPRRVAVSLALALSSGPHLEQTLGRVLTGANPLARPVGFHTDAIAAVLGIPQWEIDDLRDEADRRAAFALKQARVVNWLMSRLATGLAPNRLLAQLAPGLSRETASFQGRGTRLYAVLPSLETRTPGEVLGWFPPRGEALPRVVSRHVDNALKRTLTRAIGAEPAEVDALLESVVALIPAGNADVVIARDRWRSEGWSTMTGLGDGHVLDALTTVGEETGWRQWIHLNGSQLEFKSDPRAVFDSVGAMRCNQLAWSLTAAQLARLIDGTAKAQPDAEDLDLLDFAHHLRVVVDPLLHWVVSPDTHRKLAGELGVDTSVVARSFVGLAGEWVAQADLAWIGPPKEDAPGVQTLLLRQMLALRASSVRLEDEAVDLDRSTTLRLFVAHYAREARVERLWRWSGPDTGTGSFGWTDDPLGDWFSPLWTRLVDQHDADLEQTDWG